MSLDFSLWKRAQDSIAQGALTNSKHPDRHVFGVYPTHIAKGSGCHLFTETGRRYTDYICGLGTNLLGYGNSVVVQEIQKHLLHGFSHSIPTHHEIELAEILKEMFVFVDKWKFLKSGSEACSAAIRMARTYTGRENVLSEGYHGWHDEFVSLAAPAYGVPKYGPNKAIFSLTDFKKIIPDSIAAIVVEPVITDHSSERQKELQKLRDFCTKYSIVLIFDEVITGFRFDKFSVAQYFGITPDLFVIGKAMANGMPLAAVGGKRDLMDSDYFVSSTYAGEILSMVAAKAVAKFMMYGPPSFKISALWERGANFIDKFNKIADPFLKLEAYPTRGLIKGQGPKEYSERFKTLFLQEAAKADMLFCGTWFYNFHLPENDFIFFTFLEDFIGRLKLGSIKLEGKMPLSPFAERVRNVQRTS